MAYVIFVLIAKVDPHSLKDSKTSIVNKITFNNINSQQQPVKSRFWPSMIQNAFEKGSKNSLTYRIRQYKLSILNFIFLILGSLSIIF